MHNVSTTHFILLLSKIFKGIRECVEKEDNSPLKMIIFHQ